MQRNCKKIGIVTIGDLRPNYGNRLQNYAIVKIVNSLGAEATTYVVESVKAKEKIKDVVNRMTGFKLSRNPVQARLYYEKRKKFNDFNRKNIVIKTVNSVNHLSEKADLFIVGSDQVWNPAWYEEYPLRKELYLLSFAKSDQKIALSPSFGVDKLPIEWENWFTNNLKTFKHLSVREQAGAEIIRHLIGKEAEVLIDPTLMLSCDEWMQLIDQIRNDTIDYNKPYLLTYFLGEKTDRVKMDIEKISKDYGLEVYHLKDYTQQEIFTTDPAQFIKLISKAAIILTDSFHACVFSFLFERPFLVYNRQSKEGNMMSRIETLLTMFQLERKYVDSGIDNQIFECNYTEGYKCLEIEKQKFMKYLLYALELC